MMWNTAEYLKAIKRNDNFFVQKQDELEDVVDILVGIMNMCKQNFSGMEKLALKVGGFPTEAQMKRLTKILS